jgi:hypothetical protein
MFGSGYECAEGTGLLPILLRMHTRPTGQVSL